MKYLFSYLILFAFSISSLQAQTVSCSRGEPTTTLIVTIVDSTPNGANFDYNLTVEISNGPPEPYEITYNGTGTFNLIPPILLDSSTGPTAATITDVPNGTMGTFTATLVFGGNSCTTPPLTFNSVANSNVPTLSEWGLIVLALVLMTLGTLYLIQLSREDAL